MAKCPNCDRTIRWDVAECPACSASFGNGSTWYPVPESTDEIAWLKGRYPALRGGTQSVASRLEVANVSLALAFGLAYLFSPGGRLLALFVDRPLLQSIGAPGTHVINIFANYWLLAVALYFAFRLSRADRFLKPAANAQRLLGTGNALLIFYIGARAFASAVQGGGASFLVASIAPFIVYPAWLLIAGGLAWLAILAARSDARISSRRFTPAEVLALVALVVIPASIAGQALYGKGGPLRLAAEALSFFNEKCALAGERLIRKASEEVQGLYFDPNGARYFERIERGVYSGHGSGVLGEPLVNTGWLLFFERKPLFRSKGSEPATLYTRHYLRDRVGQPAHELQSRYGVFSRELVDPAVSKTLGVRGTEIRIVDLKTDEVIADTTFFASEKHRRFCGSAPDGSFKAESFIRRALNLKRQYPSIAPAKPQTR